VAASPTRPDVVVFKDDLQNPMVHEYDLILEQRIATNTMVSVSYVGSLGRHLPLFVDKNLPAPAGSIAYQAVGGPLDGQAITTPLFTGARPNGSFSRITTISDIVQSKYNGLVVQVNRRLNKGLQFQASYTEARATDNGQTSQTFTTGNNVLNPFDLGLEEGTSNFEIRHRFVANAIWNPSVGSEGTTLHAIFDGFTVSPTFSTSSGVPYTATLSGNPPSGTGAISTGILGGGGLSRIPSIARNAYNLPKTANFDVRIARGFAVGGGHRIEGVLDIFNVTNRLNYTAINTQMYSITGTAAAPTLTFNAPVNGAGGFQALSNANSNYFVFTPRQVQLAVRYTF
jgi:hypothetical protein